MHEANLKIYEFDNFRLDVTERQLLKNRTPVTISPKAFDLLVALVENKGRLVERESLYAQVWPDSIVEDANLTVHISAIRKALEEPSCISTVSGHGYRFNWPVKEVNGTNGRASLQTNPIRPERFDSGANHFALPEASQDSLAQEPEPFTTRVASNRRSLIAGMIGVVLITALGIGSYLYYTRGSSSQIESIAVMPFANETGNPDLEYISDGITEMLIGRLSQLSGLNVKAPSSVFRYKGKNVDAQTVGRELNVQAILHGRVVQNGEDLTLYLSLIDAKTENQIWGKQYNRKVIDLVSLQAELAQDVAANLKSKLSGAEEQKLAKSYTPNPEAHQLYLKGRFQWNRRPRNHKVTIDYFNQAIALDPNYALAYAGLADAHADAGVQFSREKMLKAREAAEKALKLDDDLSAAHASLGKILLSDYDFRGAERELKRSIELDPNYPLARHWYGNLLHFLGRFDEAISEHRRGIEIDPLLPLGTNGLARTLLAARRYDEAIAEFQKVIEMHPDDPAAYSGTGKAYGLKGDHSRFVEYYAKFWEAKGQHEFAASMRQSFAAGGSAEVQRAMIRHGIDGNLLSYDVAGGYSSLGDNDPAFEQLNRSFERREPILASIKVDSRFDGIRDDPRYAELLRKIGFPQ